MPTTGIVNGTNLRFYIGAVAVGHATSCSLTISRTMRSILTKDSAGSYEQVAPGQLKATGSGSGLFSYDTANYGVDDLFTAINAGTSLTVRFTTDVTGDKYWEGSAYLTNLNFEGPVEENSTYSFDIEFNGAITQGTEA